MDEMTTNTGFGQGYGWLIIILLFFMAFGNGNLFGGNNAATTGLSDLERDVLNGNSATQRDVLTTASATDAAIAQSRYDTLLGQNTLQSQMATCCCDLKTTMHNEGEATRALITQNRIADLQDQLDTARAAVANATQTQNILNSLGRYVSNPSTPYVYYGGTTIA